MVLCGVDLQGVWVSMFCPDCFPRGYLYKLAFVILIVFSFWFAFAGWFGYVGFIVLDMVVLVVCVV